MPTTVTLHITRPQQKFAVGDSTVALAFAIVPAALMATAIMIYGFNPVMAWAASAIG